MQYRTRKADELKPSGVAWLGDIPREWEVSKLKYISKIFNGATPKSANEIFWDGNIIWVTPKDISACGNNYLITSNRMITSSGYESCGTSLVPKNSIILTTRAPIGNIAIADKELCTNQGCKSLIVSRHTNYKYIYYILLSANKILQSLGVGTTFLELSTNNLASFYIPSFINEEQQKIANFLDEKSKIFDSILSKKELLIKKLQDAKQSLISEVVSGKLKVIEKDGKLQTIKREEKELKQSGVDWLSEIPKEWEVKKIKYLFTLRNERNFKEKHEVELLSLYTSLGVKRQKDIKRKQGNKSQTVYDYKFVYKNDIVVNIILAWMGSIGMSQYHGVTSPAYDIYKPFSNVYSNYYNYLFRTERFAGECFVKGRGIMLMRWRTYSDEFKSIYTSYPKFEEQKQIATYLDEKINLFDTTIEKTSQSIVKLKLAKESLISEAVTGKIEIL